VTLLMKARETRSRVIVHQDRKPNPPQHGGINTNIRNPLSPHWRRWTKPANPKNDPTVETRNRCLVPATSFSEYDDKPNARSLRNSDGSPHPMAGKKDVVWFALDKSRPLFSFAGIWTDWEGAAAPSPNQSRANT
jgi:putative SOS response-associated peptidase YedK